MTVRPSSNKKCKFFYASTGNHQRPRFPSIHQCVRLYKAACSEDKRFSVMKTGGHERCLPRSNQNWGQLSPLPPPFLRPCVLWVATYHSKRHYCVITDGAPGICRWQSLGWSGRPVVPMAEKFNDAFIDRIDPIRRPMLCVQYLRNHKNGHNVSAIKPLLNHYGEL